MKKQWRMTDHVESEQDARSAAVVSKLMCQRALRTKVSHKLLTHLVVWMVGAVTHDVRVIVKEGGVVI
jgi:hypothetical protein